MKRKILILCGIIGLVIYHYWDRSPCSDKQYWPDGKIASEADIECFGVSFGGGGIIDGVSKTWDEKGNLTYEGWYHEGANGPQTWYAPTNDLLLRLFWHGRVLDHWVWHNNKPVDGKRISIWPDGKVHSETNYLNGQLNGRVASWADNGQVLSDEQYVNGQPVDGPVVTYFASGKIDLKAARVNGKWDGPYVEYYEDGSLMAEGRYKFGNKDGEYKKWNEFGKLIDDENWKGGKKDGKQTIVSEERLANSNKYVNVYINVSYFSEGYLFHSVEYWSNGNKKHEIYLDRNGKKMALKLITSKTGK